MTDDSRTAADARTWISDSVAETERAGAALAPALRPGDVVAISGPLGAGSTRVVAGLAKALGWRGEVRSPTFALIHEYRGAYKLVPADVYRLVPDEVDGLGLEELGEQGPLVVEWGEKLPARMREDALVVEMEIEGETRRRITARGRGRGASLVEAWTVPDGGPPAGRRSP
jgi:tRNA threonylcarbamoyladenosine biosynthesis protein TsaE